MVEYSKRRAEQKSRQGRLRGFWAGQYLIGREPVVLKLESERDCLEIKIGLHRQGCCSLGEGHGLTLREITHVQGVRGAHCTLSPSVLNPDNTSFSMFPCTHLPALT